MDTVVSVMGSVAVTAAASAWVTLKQVDGRAKALTVSEAAKRRWRIAGIVGYRLAEIAVLGVIASWATLAEAVAADVERCEAPTVMAATEATLADLLDHVDDDLNREVQDQYCEICGEPAEWPSETVEYGVAAKTIAPDAVLVVSGASFPGDLKGLTIRQLKALAKNRKVPKYSSLTKAQLVEVLRS